jgi:thioredoxin reductase (NADPH)
VHLVHRRGELRASKIMATRALENPKITIHFNSGLAEVLGDDTAGVTGVRLVDTVDPSREKTLDAAGVFLAIGHTPNTAFLDGQLELTPKKYIVWKQHFRTATSVEGVFAAGDVADDYYRQAISAAGTGCMSALDAERWLAERGDH